jgi:hypothetical protein
MNHCWEGAALLAAGFVVLAGCHHRAARASIVRSNFIFEATVQQVGGSALPNYLRPGSETLIVKVIRALTGEFQEFEGQTVTASLVRDSRVGARSVRVGQTLVFLANPLVYADTLVVEAEARKASAALEQQALRRPQLLIEDRVRLAEVIVDGTVTHIEKVPTENHVSDFEHDPEWVKATVNVRSVIRGGDLRQVDVFFPASRDLIWYAAPRFYVRQSGTWLLHLEELGGRRKERALVALNALDFQEGSTQAEAIRRLARDNPHPSNRTKTEQLEGR